MIDPVVFASAMITLMGVSLAVLIALIKIVAIGQDLRTTVEQIKNNDLHALKNDIRELRKILIQHLMEAKNGTTNRPTKT